MMFVEPGLGRHAHVGSRGVADPWPDRAELMHAEVRIAAGPSEDGHLVTPPSQVPGQGPGVSLPAASERLGAGKACRGDQRNPQPPPPITCSYRPWSPAAPSVPSRPLSSGPPCPS